MNRKECKGVYSPEEIKKAARGRELDILEDVAGIDGKYLDGKHHPCPKCGGKDRFRLVNADDGAVFCNQCFNEQCGDFIAAVRHFRGVSFHEALALIAADLQLQPTASEESTPWKKIKTWSYTDPDGKSIYHVTRKERLVNGKRQKQFLQHRIVDGSKVYDIKGVTPVPLNLPEIIDQAERPIYIVEGETCCDALTELGRLATTGSGGSNTKVRWEEFIKNRRVVLLPDNDKPGVQYANRIAKALGKAGNSIKIVRLPDLGEGEDVVDWLEEGGTKDDLLRIVNETPVWDGEPFSYQDDAEQAREADDDDPDDEDERREFGSLPHSSVFKRWQLNLTNGVPSIRYSIADEGNDLNVLAPEPETISTIGGAPGSSKTALANQIVLDALRRNKEIRALIANVEQTPYVLLNRELARAADFPYKLIRRKQLDDVERQERLERGFARIAKYGDRLSWMQAPMTIERIVKEARRVNADIVLVDYIQKIYTADKFSSDRERIDAVMSSLIELKNEGRAIIVVSALSRQTTGSRSYQNSDIGSYRGSSDLEFSSTNAFMLKKVDDNDDYNRLLLCHKMKEDEPVSLKLKFRGSRMSFEAVGIVGEEEAEGRPQALTVTSGSTTRASTRTRFAV